MGYASTRCVACDITHYLHCVVHLAIGILVTVMSAHLLFDLMVRGTTHMPFLRDYGMHLHLVFDVKNTAVEPVNEGHLCMDSMAVVGAFNKCFSAD